jgi:hypothetical protein
MGLTCNLIHKLTGEESLSVERAEERMVLKLRFGETMKRV